MSVGSTPTAHFARDLSGVTEVRAGVYVFFDLVMIMVDAGWMAMSRDRGTANQAVDQGYGLVCDIEGRMLDDLIVTAANQEHGIIALRPCSKASLPELPVGTRLRILPNHACATAAQFDGYEVLSAKSGAPLAQWARFRGW